MPDLGGPSPQAPPKPTWALGRHRGAAQGQRVVGPEGGGGGGRGGRGGRGFLGAVHGAEVGAEDVADLTGRGHGLLGRGPVRGAPEPRSQAPPPRRPHGPSKVLGARLPSPGAEDGRPSQRPSALPAPPKPLGTPEPAPTISWPGLQRRGPTKVAVGAGGAQDPAGDQARADGTGRRAGGRAGRWTGGLGDEARAGGTGWWTGGQAVRAGGTGRRRGTRRAQPQPQARGRRRRKPGGNATGCPPSHLNSPGAPPRRPAGSGAT